MFEWKTSVAQESGVVGQRIRTLPKVPLLIPFLARSHPLSRKQCLFAREGEGIKEAVTE